MTTIWYNSIENVLLNISDPNTWGTITWVPWVSSPKINATTSVYNQSWGSGIAWWSTNVNWYSSDYNTVRWGSWDINLPDWTILSVTSGNTGDMSTTTYIYYDRSDDTVKTTTSSADSVWEKKILLCVASPTTSWKDSEFQAFWTNKQSTFIYADNIAANTITGNEIASNTIKAWQIDSWAITTDKIAVWAVTADEIEDWAVVADKINVSTLSAITGNMWDLYVWDIDNWNWINIYPYSSSQGRIQFYYNGSSVGYIEWQYSSWVWSWVVLLNGSYIVFDGETYMLNRDIMDLSQAKLRIPVWDNLY